MEDAVIRSGDIFENRRRGRALSSCGSIDAITLSDDGQLIESIQPHRFRRLTDPNVDGWPSAPLERGVQAFIVDQIGQFVVGIEARDTQGPGGGVLPRPSSALRAGAGSA